jgi:Methyltransferase FkbM domain
MRLLPDAVWKGLLRTPPLRFLRDRLVGPSDTKHLASGPVRFERLAFEFVAPYAIWNKARTRGIENRICRVIMTRARPGSVAIDVGANCGFLTLIMGFSVGEGGRVLAFEPDAGYFDVLGRNVRANDFDGRCQLYQARVGRSVEEGMVTLDTIAEERGITSVDLIKIDVDGADYDVLLGARRLLERTRPTVIVEMSEKQDAIYALLKDELGYAHCVGMSGEPVVPGQWPLNLIAADQPIVIPARGALS